MHVRVTESFVAETRQTDLRFTCADCAYALPRGGCAHGWPDEQHRRAPVVPSGGSALAVFCKEFELE